MLHCGKSHRGRPLSRSRERVGVRVAGITTPLRRQNPSKDLFRAAAVLVIDFVEQRLDLSEISLGFGRMREIRRHAADVQAIHAPRSARMQRQIPAGSNSRPLTCRIPWSQGKMQGISWNRGIMAHPPQAAKPPSRVTACIYRGEPMSEGGSAARAKGRNSFRINQRHSRMGSILGQRYAL